MSNLGIGVMLRMLGDNVDSVKAYTSNLNKVISNIELSENQLVITFVDNTKLLFSDEGQSCCENRYMVCPDNLKEFIGATFIGAEIKDAPNILDSSEEHEVQFLDINTSKGTFQCSNHNEHNGYYGGFAIVCRQVNL